MESVLLGMAAPVAVTSAGSLLEGTLRTATQPFAALLQALTFPTSTESEDSVPSGIEELHGSLESLRDDVAAKIEKALTSAGVDLAEPITLRISPTDGHLEVVGDPPQKALIEAALADDPDLVNEFTEVAALEQLLATMAKPTDSTIVPLGQDEQDPVTAIFTMNGESADIEFN